MVDGERLNRRISELAAFGGNASGGVTRLAYSEADRQACGWIEEVMRAAGLDVHVDAAGNRVGRRAGQEGRLPPIVTGSHIDSVADGGRYDGAVGALAAVEVQGRANHAGSTPMDRRQDALLAASRFVDAVNRVVTSRSGRQVGTVGALQVFPGAPDIVPGRVELSLDIRDVDQDRIGAFFLELQGEAAGIGQGTGTEFSFTRYHLHEPVETHPVIREVLEEAANELGLTSCRLLSGAGHDAQTIGKIAPVGLIFIPSVGGVSHSAEEYSRPEDIRNGAAVLLRSVLKLDAMTLA